ncbi:MAG TPA: MliC family protein [Candidatus Paceibacterota bacterium]|nr:MliC family protein [Candidatus Paceibacterota bacterium]
MTKKDILALIGLVIVIVAVGTALLRPDLVRRAQEQQQPCPADAKICPDGSSIGRTGPNCEFAACPGEATGTQPISGANSSTMPSAAANDVMFVCGGGNSIHATFYAANRVTLQLSDGRMMTLPQVRSADGARYANSDESFVFWNKGNTAFFQEGKKVPYHDCVVDTSGQVGITLPPAQPFSQTGVVIANNPGLTPNTPYLSYEQSGKPGLMAELRFDGSSICGDGKNFTPCNALDVWPPFVNRRVSVVGVLQGGIVFVQRLVVQ